MALHLNPSPQDPGEPESRSAGGHAAGEEIRPGVATDELTHVLAHGALLCPQCDVPIVITEAMPAGRRVECGACGSASRAHELVARDVFDTVSNEVYVIGRVPAAVVRRSRRRTARLRP